MWKWAIVQFLILNNVVYDLLGRRQLLLCRCMQVIELESYAALKDTLWCRSFWIYGELLKWNKYLRCCSYDISEDKTYLKTGRVLRPPRHRDWRCGGDVTPSLPASHYGSTVPGHSPYPLPGLVTGSDQAPAEWPATLGDKARGGIREPQSKAMKWPDIVGGLSLGVRGPVPLTSVLRCVGSGCRRNIGGTPSQDIIQGVAHSLTTFTSRPIRNVLASKSGCNEITPTYLGALVFGSLVAHLWKLKEAQGRILLPTLRTWESICRADWTTPRVEWPWGFVSRVD